MGEFFGFAPIVTNIVPTKIYTDITRLPIHLVETTHVFDSDHGKSFRVWGFSVSNVSGGSATGSVITDPLSIQRWAGLIGAGQTIVIPIPFIADSGLAVTTTVASALSYTFWHSQIGA